MCGGRGRRRLCTDYLERTFTQRGQGGDRFDVTVDRIVGVYSNPGYVTVYDDGEIRQEFSVCCACTIVGGAIRVSVESTAVEFFEVADIEDLKVHDSTRTRIRDYVAGDRRYSADG
jgi:hypothetical protein